MNQTVTIRTPLHESEARLLRSGTNVLISGELITARDAAHKRLCECIDRGEPLPVNLENQIVYFAGPTPARPPAPIGSAGPTTSSRMDAYSPKLIEHSGLRGMIGKGNRSDAVIEAMSRFGCVYFAALGGGGALLAQSIKEVSVLAYEDLGPEAIRRFVVKDFPCIVAIDTHGNNLYESGPSGFRTPAKNVTEL